MKYEIIDSVHVKRTKFELLYDGKKFYVAKNVNCKVTFLYFSSKKELATKFYERIIEIN